MHVMMSQPTQGSAQVPQLWPATLQLWPTADCGSAGQLPLPPPPVPDPPEPAAPPVPPLPPPLPPSSSLDPHAAGTSASRTPQTPQSFIDPSEPGSPYYRTPRASKVA